MMPIAAGTPLLDLFVLAYEANLPVLLHGRHGVGKSEIGRQAARRLGVRFLPLDLSLLEPIDLVGIPQVQEDGRTHYAPPKLLPDPDDDVGGILMLEELNRAPEYMRAPCLRLLSDRCLNDYKLPSSWVPCASVNDAADGYQVGELDAALLSRFLQGRVVPDVDEWVRWARGPGAVHGEIIRFVEDNPGIFDDPDANPRAWANASKLLTCWEAGKHGRSNDLLAIGLTGLVGDKWGVAFLQACNGSRTPLPPKMILEEYPSVRAAVKRWIAEEQFDMISESLEHLKRFLQPQPAYNCVIRDVTQKGNVKTFISDLPQGLRERFREWLEDRGFSELAVPRAVRR
jgi:hypothetical protein